MSERPDRLGGFSRDEWLRAYCHAMPEEHAEGLVQALFEAQAGTIEPGASQGIAYWPGTLALLADVSLDCFERVKQILSTASPEFNTEYERCRQELAEGRPPRLF